MRLLKVDQNGVFSPITFAGSNIPQYAILSHTWEAENQEVTYQDMINGLGNDKFGYRKIRFCSDQAQRDGLQYFWVDSCCIDKTSSAELSEAINSMYRWYKNAVKCYVYLSDVSADRDQSPGSPPPSFRRSRWFTRGWTLQELLAPQSVEFFSHDGKLLGDKRSLEAEIQDITSIANGALQGKPLSQITVEERMSWAQRRVTSIEEDRVYCLLGIFDTYLPLLYGEGFSNASRRLREEIEKSGTTHGKSPAALMSL
jgi:hypothetical protein